jgi:signal transduction histidine kinase
MRERLGILAGTLEVESEPGAGTAISATVPTLSRLAEP